MDIVAKVGITLCRTALGSKECPCFEKASFSCAEEHPGRMARAALAAMLEAVGEPVAWRYDYLDQFSGVRTELSLTRWSTRHRQGWTETPLYSLAALREEL